MAVKLTNGQNKPVVIFSGRRKVKLFPGESKVVPGNVEQWPNLFGVVKEATDAELTSEKGNTLERLGVWKVTNKRVKPHFILFNGQHKRLVPNESVVLEGDYNVLVSIPGLLVEPVSQEELESGTIDAPAKRAPSICIPGFGHDVMDIGKTPAEILQLKVDVDKLKKDLAAINDIKEASDLSKQDNEAKRKYTKKKDKEEDTESIDSNSN